MDHRACQSTGLGVGTWCHSKVSPEVDQNDTDLFWLKENYTDDKYFDIMYRSIYWTCFRTLVLFKTWLYLSKNQIKIDFPYYTIIEHSTMCRMCWWDSKASTVTSYPLVNRVLALLSNLRWSWQHTIREKVCWDTWVNFSFVPLTRGIWILLFCTWRSSLYGNYIPPLPRPNNVEGCSMRPGNMIPINIVQGGKGNDFNWWL